MKTSFALVLVLFSVLASSASVVQAEEVPSATDLFVGADSAQEGTQGTPVLGVGQTPCFSAVFQHENPGVVAIYFEVQVAPDSQFDSVHWGSGWIEVKDVGIGKRCEDVGYEGEPLELETVYYWRARFRVGEASEPLGWSTEDASFRSLANQPPVLVPPGTFELTEGDAFALTLDASDPDPNTTFTYAAEGLPAGAVFDSESGALNWTPGFSQAGEYVVSFVVSDNDPIEPLEDQQSASIIIADANGAPTISTSTEETEFGVAESSLLVVDLLVADPDLNDGLSVTAAQVSGDPLPSGAQIVLGADGYRFEWTTDYDQAGDHFIKISVSDDGSPSLSSWIDLMISVENTNRPPTLNLVPKVVVAEGESLSIQLVASDPDVEDTLIFSASDPMPSGASLDSEFGVVSWTPSFTQAGQYEFTVSVQDNSEPILSATTLVSIEVTNTNQAPVIDPIGDYLIYEGADLLFSVSAYDPDAEGEVTVTAALADGNPLPAGATFGNDGTFAWTPAFQQSGSYQIRFVAEDDYVPPASTDQVIMVTVVNVNRAPSLTNPGDHLLDEGAPFTLSLAASDPDTGDTLTYSLEMASGEPLPSGLSIDSATGSIEWTPLYNQSGEYSVLVRVTDNGDPILSDSAAFSFVVNDVPHSVELNAFFPDANAANVAAGTIVDASYSEAMNTPQSGQFQVRSNWRGAVGGTRSVDGTSIQFNTSAGYFAGETVEVSLSSGLQSTLGASTEVPFVWRFTAATAPSEAGLSKRMSPFGSPDAAIRDAIVADFDNDGDLDVLVMASSAENANYLFSNDGQGNLAATSIVGVGAEGAAGFRLLDYNGDSLTDVLYWIGETGYVYVNQGGLQFNVEETITFPHLNTMEVETGDVTGDGRSDILIVTNTGLVSILVRAGTGFAPAGDFDHSAGETDSYSIELADMYADGGLEVVVAGAGTLSVLSYGYTGPFTLTETLAISAGPVRDLDVIDTNGDLRPDIYVNGTTLWVHVSHPTDGFEPGELIDTNGATVMDVQFGDLDGDTDQDLILAFADYSLVMLNTGNGQQFQAHEAVGNAIDGEPVPQIMRVFAADLNSDHQLDVVNLRGAGFSRIFFNESRLRASVLDAEAVAPHTGEREVLVPVSLDFVPVNAVTVFYQTVDLSPLGGDPSDDKLPDPADFMETQSGPSAFIHISGFLTFQPGVQTQWIAVTLTASPPTSGQFSFAVQISAVAGLPGVIQPGNTLISASSANVSVAQSGVATQPPTASLTAPGFKIKGQVNASSRLGDVVYLGGDFQSVGWPRSNLVYREDSGLPLGLDISALDGGQGTFTGTIYVFETDASGNIYAGGNFEYTFGSNTFHNILKINGTSWNSDANFNPSPVIAPAGGDVRAIEIQGDLVFFGGQFDTVGGNPDYWSLGCWKHNPSTGTYADFPTARLRDGASFLGSVTDLAWRPHSTAGNHLIVTGDFDSATNGSPVPLPQWETSRNLAAFRVSATDAEQRDPTPWLYTSASTSFTNAVELAGNSIFVGGAFTEVQPIAGPPAALFNLQYSDHFVVLHERTNGPGFELRATNGGLPRATPVFPVDDIVYYDSSGNTERVVLAHRETAAPSTQPRVYTITAGAFQFSTDLATPHLRTRHLELDGEVLWVASDDAPTSAGFERNFSGYDLSDAGFGTRVTTEGNVDGPISALLATPSGKLLIAGSFGEYELDRSNLAALDHTTGGLLDWRPRTNGVVHAIDAFDQKVFYGGDFTAVNGVSAHSHLSASPAFGSTGDPDEVILWGTTGYAISANGPVYALTHNVTETALFVGGNFTQLVSSTRMSLGAINPDTSSGQAGLAYSFDPNVELASAAGSVHAIATNGDDVYFGGQFDTVGGFSVNNIAKAHAVSSTVDSNWAPAVAGASAIVRALAIDDQANRIFVGGLFDAIDSTNRANAAALTLSTGQLVSGWQMDSNGVVHTLVLSSNGSLHVGGEFTFIGGSAHLSLALADGPTGIVSSWSPLLKNAMGSGTPPPIVQTLTIAPTTLTERLIVGGDFLNIGVVPNEVNLTWYDLPVTIATSSLPIATEGDLYAYQLTLNYGVAATWTLGTGTSSAISPYLEVDALTGELRSIDPQTGAPAALPTGLVAPQSSGVFNVHIRADVAGGNTAQRNYSLVLEGAAQVSLRSTIGTNPGHLDLFETDDAVRNNPSVLEVLLDKPVTHDVQVEVTIVNGSAVEGRDFVLSNAVVLIPAGNTSAQLDVIVFGDNIAGQSPRTFIAVASRVVTGTAILAQTSLNVVGWIHEDDTAGPAVATARDLEVRNDPLLPAQQFHVVVPTPYFRWQFYSDDPSRTQNGYVIELFHTPQLTAPVLIDVAAPGSAKAQDNFWFSPVGLLKGESYWMRIWLTNDLLQQGDPVILPFRLNSAPSTVTGLTPSGIVTDSTPVFSFVNSADLENDSLHYRILLTPQSSGGPITLDSEVAPSAFEFELGGTWWPLTLQGVPQNATNVRATLPSSMALSADMYEWVVIASDSYEQSLQSVPILIDLTQLSYDISGVVTLPGGQVDTTYNENVNIVRIGDWTVIAQVQAAAGSFTATVSTPLSAGDTLAVFLADSRTQPGFPLKGSTIRRFNGNDLTAASGPDAALDIRIGRLWMGQIAASLMTLEDLVSSGSSPYNSLAGWNVPSGSNVIVESWVASVAVDSTIVVGPNALGGPSTLILPGSSPGPQLLEIGTHGEVQVQASCVVEAPALANLGSLILAPNATAVIHISGTNEGSLYVSPDAMLEANGAALVSTAGNFTLKGALTLESGTFQLAGSASIIGAAISGNASASGIFEVTTTALTLSDTSFNHVALIVRPTGGISAASDLSFTGNAPGSYLTWESEAAGTSPTWSRTEFGAVGASGPPSNVTATLTSLNLTFLDSRGAGSGPQFETDPANTVHWDVTQISTLACHPGDGRILIVWADPGGQPAGVSFNIYDSNNSTAPIATTTDEYWVHSGLINGVFREYFLTVVQGGTESAPSEVIGCTPRTPTLGSIYPSSTDADVFDSLLIVGEDTHWDASTVVYFDTGGPVVSAQGIQIVTPTLIRADIDTTGVAPGTWNIYVETQGVWSTYGVLGYNEVVSSAFEVEAQASLNDPLIEFTDTSGGVIDESMTQGAFLIELAFDENGGETVDVDSLELYADRVVYVGGIGIQPGLNLADPAHTIFDSVSTTGASAQIEQVQSAQATDQWFEPGEYNLTAIVYNQSGIDSLSAEITIYVDALSGGATWVTGILHQGGQGQQLVIKGASLSNVIDVEFSPSTGIQVIPGSMSYQPGTPLDTVLVDCNAADDCDIGLVEYVAISQPGTGPNIPGSVTVAPEWPDLSNVVGSLKQDAVHAGIGVRLNDRSFTAQQTDLYVPGRGLDLNWSRTYQSGLDQRGPLGWNWVGYYFQAVYLQKSSTGNLHDLYWLNPAGDVVNLFSVSTGTTLHFIPSVAGTNIWARYSKSRHMLGISFPDGSQVQFRIKPINGTGSSTQDHSGPGQLYKIIDRYGNGIHCYYESIGKGLPKRLSYVRDTRYLWQTRGLAIEWYKCGLVHRVKDEVWDPQDPRIVEYGYDADLNLTVAWSPETERYKSTSMSQNDYYAGRIANGYEYYKAGDTVIGGTFPSNKKGIIKHVYNPDSVGSVSYIIPDSRKHFSVNGTAVLTNGVDTTGQIVEQVESPDATTSYTTKYGRLWDSSSSAFLPPSAGVEVISPKGYRTKYILDAKGRETEVTRFSETWALNPSGPPTKTSGGSPTLNTRYKEYNNYGQVVKSWSTHGAYTWYTYALLNRNYWSLNYLTDSDEHEISTRYLIIDGYNLPSGIAGNTVLEVKSKSASSPTTRHYSVVAVTPGATSNDPDKIEVDSNMELDGWDYNGGQPNYFVTLLYAQGEIGQLPQLLEMRQSETATKTSSDFVTTYEHEEENDEDDGRYRHTVSKTRDPYGNVLINEEAPLGPSPYRGDKRYSPIWKQLFPGTLPDQWNWLKNIDSSTSFQTRVITRPRLLIEESINTYNGLGQLLSTEVLDEGGRVETKTEYVYQDTWGDQEGYLYQIKRTWNRANFDDVVVETFDRDNVGNVVQYFPPRYHNSQIPEYRTIYHVNELNQVWHVQSPGLFQSSSHFKDTYRYYDKRGNVTNIFEEYIARDPVTGTVSTPGRGANTEAPVFSGSGATFPKASAAMAATWAETTYSYDLLGRKTSEQVDAIAGSGITRYSNSWTYDEHGNATQMVNPRSVVTYYEYDERDLLISETQPSLGISTQYAYDGLGNLSEMTDGRGFVTKWEYDVFNRLKKVEHPLLNAAVGAPYETVEYSDPSPNTRHETWRAFDGNNKKLAETVTHMNEAGQRWLTMRWAYSELHGKNLASGRVVPTMTVSDNDYSIAYDLYDSLGRVRSSINDNGGSTHYVYDRLSRVGVVWDGYEGNTADFQNKAGEYNRLLGASNAIAYTYDLDSNVTAVSSFQIDEDYGESDPGRRVKSIAKTKYELNSLPFEVIDARSRTTKMLYDGWGRVVRRTDPDDSVVYFEYDLLSRVTKQTVKNPTTGDTVTSTVYDQNGNVTQRTVESGSPAATTKFEYDALDRLTKVIAPDSGEWVYTYDKSSNLISMRDPGGTLVVDTVNSWGLVDLRNITKQSDTVGTGSEYFEYDGLGRLTLAATYEGNDRTDQLTEVTWAYNTVSLPEKQSLKVWDQNHNLISGFFAQRPDYTEPNTGLNTSRYLGQSHSYSAWPVTHMYDGLGFTREVEYWDGRKVEHLPDDERKLNRLFTSKDLSNKDASGAIQLANYSYFGSGRLTSRKHGPVSGSTGTRVDVDFEPIVPDGDTTAYPTGNPTKIISRRGTDHFEHISGTERAYSPTGVTLYERRSHLAGLGRVYRYDESHQLTTSYSGVDLGAHYGAVTGSYENTANLPSNADYQREFDLDTRGNRSGTSAVTDKVRGSTYATDDYELSSNGLSQYTKVAGLGGYTYDANDRLSFDPSTGLSYKYDYKGALVEVRNGGELLQEYRYDALGRRVLTTDVPEDPVNKRHTITIPAIGAGDPATGSKPAGDVTIDASGNAVAAVQYTYGVGVTTPGSIGTLHPMTAASPSVQPSAANMMVLEFVAYNADGFPYYRFRHEDQTGSLISTTNIKGDRLDEYDYLDYGTPIWKPISFDGHPSKITGVTLHPTHPDTVVIQLNQDFLKHNELAGDEVRFLDPTTSNYKDRYVTGLIESNSKNTINVHDPSGAVLGASAGVTPHDFVVFDLSSGFQGGNWDTITTGSEPNRKGSMPASVPVTYLEDVEQPFHVGHRSEYIAAISRKVTIWLDNSPNPPVPMEYEVYDIQDRDNDMLYETLILEGDLSSVINVGDAYRLPLFDRDLSHATQSGRWLDYQYDAGMDQTWFEAERYSLFDDFMRGWLLQPNNQADAYFPVVNVDKDARKLYVAGDVTSLLTTTERRFHLYAPPGTDRIMLREGARKDTGLAESSMHLFAGYRYQAPSTGVWDFLGNDLAGEQADSKLNKAGLYYLHNRMYDPTMGRFLTPDPLAAPFYNLYEYASHRPLDLSDPTGLKEAGDKNVSFMGYDMGFRWDVEEGKKRLNQQAYDVYDFSRNYAQAMWNDPQNTLSGTGYGLINAVTGGLYGEIVSPEEFTNAFGGDSSSAAFVGGAVLGEVIGNVAISFATAGIGCSIGMVRMAKILGTVVMLAGDIYQTGKAIQTGDMGALAMQVYGQALGRVLARTTGRSNMCFVAGTQVLTSDGSTPIEDIQVGDWVFSKDDQTGETGWKRVEQLFRSESDELVRMSYAIEGDTTTTHTLSGSAEHPLWIVEVGDWVEMGELQSGWHLLLANGDLATIRNVSIDYSSAPVALYNFEVEDWHTYYVASGESVDFVWVHNACGPAAAKKSIARKVALLKKQGLQEHHIVSWTNRHTKNHPLVKLAGFDLKNSQRNKIYLPSSVDAPGTRSIHLGRHTNAHSRRLAQKMTVIADEGLMNNWTQKQFDQAFRKLLSEERQLLKAGDVALNKNHRPWATIK